MMCKREMIVISISQFLLWSPAATAWSQPQPEQDFFDKYLPIAQLFDNPFFVYSVFGIAILMIAFSYGMIFYGRKVERQAEQWAEGKTSDELIAALQGEDEKAAHYAFVYLRRHPDMELTPSLIKILQESRKQGNANPYAIYLLEDYEAYEAIPVLKSIGKGKSATSKVANRTAATLTARQTAEAHSDNQ